MTLTTYVNFAGTCAEAFRFYEKHLGGKIGMMMTHGQSPQPGPVGPEWKDAVLHARIAVAGTELMGGRYSERAADAQRLPVAGRE